MSICLTNLSETISFQGLMRLNDVVHPINRMKCSYIEKKGHNGMT